MYLLKSLLYLYDKLVISGGIKCVFYIIAFTSQTIIKSHYRNFNLLCSGVHCPGGQVYQMCGNTCTRSCYDISQNPQCRRQCVEGCNCPEGQTIDPTTGECIPVGRCACQHDGVEYPAGFQEIRAGNKGLELW